MHEWKLRTNQRKKKARYQVEADGKVIYLSAVIKKRSTYSALKCMDKKKDGAKLGF